MDKMNCEKCRYREPDHDGYCYMFKDKPDDYCEIWRGRSGIKVTPLILQMECLRAMAEMEFNDAI